MIEKTAWNRNPFLGLYVRATDDLVVAAPNAPPKLLAAIERVLQPRRVLFTNIANSPLVGLFAVANSTGVVLTPLAEESEIRAFREQGLNTASLPPQFGAVGNSLVANDRAALANPNLPPEAIRAVADALGVEVFQHRFAGAPTLGAFHVATNHGVFASNELSDVELKKLESVFGVHADRGTVNLGTPFNALGVVANSRGALVGELTTGFEVQRVYQALFG